MGRNMFGGHGAWADQPWDGWWGDDPPFHTPVFVVTHHPREPARDAGRHDVHVRHGRHRVGARAGAGGGGRQGRDSLGGGASIVQQYLKAGLLDELQINLVPVLLGGGERLFDNLDGADVRLECTRAVEAPGVTHLRYRRTVRP